MLLCCFFLHHLKKKKKKKSKNIFNLCWRWSDHGLVSFGRILLHFGFFAVISGAYIHTSIQNALLHHCCTLGKPDTKQKKHEHISVCSVFVTMQQVAINLSAPAECRMIRAISHLSRLWKIQTVKKNPIKTKVDKSPLTQSLSFSLSPPLCIALPVSHPPALFQMFLPDFGTKLNFLHLMFLLCVRNRTFLPSAKSLLVYIFLFWFFRGNAQT